MNNGNRAPINGNYATNYKRPPRTLSIPRTFFAPPTPRLLQSTAPDLKPLQMQNHSNNLQQSSQVFLQNGYEPRIRQLEQEICHLRSTEQKQIFYMRAECAKLNDLVVRKNSKLKTLENRLESRSDLRKINIWSDPHTEKYLNNDEIRFESSTMNNGNRAPINGNYATNYKRPPRTLSIPRTFFAPPTPRLLQSTAPDLKPLQMQNHSNNLQQSSQVFLQNGYEPRIRQLEQEICHLRSTEQKQIFYMRAECAKLNDLVVRKNSKLKTLENRLESRTLVFGQEKSDLEAQCAKLNDELLKKDSELEALKANLQAELQQYSLKLAIAEEENRVLKQTNALSLDQEKNDLEAQCAKFGDELLKKDSELEALKANLQVELDQLSAKLEKAEEENRELKHTNERNSHEFELKLNQMESEKEASVSSLAKLNETMAEIERDYISFINNFSSQIIEENEILEASVKANMDASKPKIEHLQVEFDRRSADLEQCIQKLASNTVDRNASIDLTKNDCNETSQSSKKKKRKLK